MKSDRDENAIEQHAVELTVWDVPATVVAGERFKLAVGAKCSAGCDLTGGELSIVDHEGAFAGTAKLGHDVCPGTEALYFAELEARAPANVGSHRWEAKIGGWNAELTHAPGSYPVTVRVVSSPDCEVTVRVVDREKQTPVRGACVVMHPYRTVSDGNGIARVRLAKGQYDMLVSGSQYIAACTSVDVTADMTTIAELDVDQPEEHFE